MTLGERIHINLVVNGQSVGRSVEPRRTLADFLREDVGLTGTHLGCEHGVCGACTVLVDGSPVRGCLMFAVQANGAEVMTVEGLSPAGQPNDLQRSFKSHHALQCGFCTPGMLTTAHAFLRANPAPTREEVQEAISGNLCRCTGYVPVVDAILATARQRQDAATQPEGTP
jgi:aerobic-type carbon monoxide dehydrogenase small subunit (CoxS/CutS family)